MTITVNLAPDKYGPLGGPKIGIGYPATKDRGLAPKKISVKQWRGRAKCRRSRTATVAFCEPVLH
jgi:hypothetical protein